MKYEELKKKLKSKNSIIKFNSINSLNEKEAKKEMKALEDAINYHDELYYKKNKPKISDNTYDQLFERLENLEKKFPQLKSKNSPTKKIGKEPKTTFKKIKHTKPLLSLQATAKKEDIKDFLKFVKKNTTNTNYILEPKFDGFSIEIIYKNGVFAYGATRGDGFIGEDISRNIKTIKTIPKKLANDSINFLSIRGEVFINKKDFQMLNKKRIQNNKKEFSNPRNAAVGLMRQLNSKNVENIPFKAIFYEIIKIKNQKIKNQNEALQYLKKLNFNVSSKNKIIKSYEKIIEKIIRYYNNFEKIRDDLNYEIDGIVIKVDEYKEREKLGRRERNPRWAIAWKFPPKKEITTLKDIVVQVGRTGILTPIALLNPVNVGGVTISKATLHNQDYIQQKGFKKGDKVKILRAGDVIPRVDELVKKINKSKKKFKLPKKCPVCKSNTIKQGAYVICPNSLSCDAQLKGRIQHFASTEAMNIRGLGEKIIIQLVDKSLVTKISDLYELKKKDFLKLEGFKNKSAKKLYEQIQNSKNPNLDRFIYALGIRLVGLKNAKVLAHNFKSFGRLMKASKRELKKIEEIGDEITKSVLNFFQNKKNRNVIKKLRENEIKPKEFKILKTQKLKKKKFVITGILRNYSRKEAKEEIEKRGGHVTENISKNTDYLIVGKKPGSKLDDAKINNIKIIYEEEFEKILKK